MTLTVEDAGLQKHSLALSECANDETDAGGLTSEEAARRLARDGPNVIDAKIHESVAAKIGRRLVEPLTAILLLSALISGITGDWQSFVIIVAIIGLSIVLDVVQEHKANLAIEALRRSVAVTAKVIRDKRKIIIPVREIVRGDVVELEGGSLVPADGCVLMSRAVLANEASLTGEPYPVEKSASRSFSNDTVDASNALYAGTSLVSGQAMMLVATTGRATRFGAIAASLQMRQPATAFELGVHRLGWLIIKLTGFLVLFVLLTQLVRYELSLQSFMFAVALAVGLTPELLPMIMTVTLARGAVRMAERQVVVKRLSAIHDLGAMNVLCTDKTGTLTEAKIRLVECIDLEGKESLAVRDLLYLNSRFASGMHSNFDDAILAAPAAIEGKGWSRIDDAPFDFDRRRSSILASKDSGSLLVTKGAPEALLMLSTKIDRPDGSTLELDGETRAGLEALFQEKGRQGLRLLGVARRTVPADKKRISPEDERDLIFVGCGVFLDPPKASARHAAERLTNSGVGLKIISGDAAPVVMHLIEALNIPARGVLSGDEMVSLTDRALAEKVLTTDVFVRTSPEQKGRIVRALKLQGLCVGYLGDGINDATAIHVADVGLSVDGGTDVAREAADIILLAPDLGVLADGVAEGRRTYANIMKYVRMGTSSNFGNMLSMALASLILPFLPLLPLQILMNNLFYDISEIGIPFDTADEATLATPQAWNINSVLGFTLIMGPLSSLFDLATFALLLNVFKTNADVFRTAWFVESIATQILVIFVIRTREPLWRSAPNPILLTTSLGALALALAVALTPIGPFVGFTPIPASVLAAIALIFVLYLAAAEGLKPLALNWSQQQGLRDR